MRISKHFINLIMLSVFGFLVVSPFTLIRPKIDSMVLGVVSEKTYYKKYIGDSSKLMSRNIVSTGIKDTDAITFTVSKSSKFANYPLYDITNVSKTPIKLVIYPSSKILGEIGNNVVTLQISNGTSVTMYEYSKEISSGSKIELNLNTGEKVTVNIIVDNLNGVDKDTTLSFDLTVEKSN